MNKQWLERVRDFFFHLFSFILSWHVVAITVIDLKCLILLPIHVSFGKDTKKNYKS